MNCVLFISYLTRRLRILSFLSFLGNCHSSNSLLKFLGFDWSRSSAVFKKNKDILEPWRNLNRNRKKEGYGVNIHDTKISYVQVNSKQKNSALIAVLNLKVTVKPSTRSKNSHLTVSSRRPLAPV